jgi:hypothetical protein
VPENLWGQKDWPNVSIDIEQKPFWPALREVCDKIGLRPQNMGGDRGLGLVQSGGGNDIMDAPVYLDGPFMVIATGATENSSVDFNQQNNRVNRSLSLQFMVYAEPKLQIVGRSYMAKIVEALDQNGKSLIGQRMYGDSFSGDPSCMWPLSASLIPGKSTADKIVRFKGSSRVVLQTQSQTWEIPDILNAGPQSKTIGGRAFTFNEIKQVGGAYQVKLTMALPQRVMGGNWEMMTGANSLRLVDEQGRQLTSQQSGTSGDGTKIEYTFSFNRNGNEGQTGEPVKLRWKLPVDAREREIPFEFKDLPLP